MRHRVVGLETREAPVGQEIDGSLFTPEDFDAFTGRLRQETRLLGDWFRQGRFAGAAPVGGLEIEAWLVGRDMAPAPVNDLFLKRLGDPLVVSELARFNVELNTPAFPLHGDALARMEGVLTDLYARCNRVGEVMDGARLVTVGILPSVRDHHLVVANMSPLQRYAALNEQVLRLRGGAPIRLAIQGRESLTAEHRDVMLEAAATSLQLHLQVDQGDAHRYYNAARILSAPMVALCANAPFLFGRDLWAETRIPLFEQAVAVAGAERGARERVSFGHEYAQGSLLRCFAKNLADFDVLLPRVSDTPTRELAHLRLHNGTIWRWTRPLIGFDPETGRPHLRIEHRVASAPTTVADTVANAAFFFGLVHNLARAEPAPEDRLPFAAARENFYRAARHGLEAEVTWLDGRPWRVDRLIGEELVARAGAGLADLGLDPGDAQRALGLVAARVQRGQNGSAWQRRFARRYPGDMVALTRAYAERQADGAPVHLWDL
jgi:hypothetical protein